jgi:choline dehydrogenase-like flavoprotein
VLEGKAGSKCFANLENFREYARCDASCNKPQKTSTDYHAHGFVPQNTHLTHLTTLTTITTTMHLSATQHQTLVAICDALIPPLQPAPNLASEHEKNEKNEKNELFWRRGASDFDVASKVAAALDFVSPAEQAEFRQLLDLLSTPLAGLFVGTLKSAPRLSMEQRERLLQTWSQSRIGLLRKGFMALKKITTFLYYGYSDDTPEHRVNPVWAAIGYPGPLATTSSPSLSTSPSTPLQTLLAEDQSVLTCDVVVIGSGAGGGVVAGELAEAGLNVIVLEKGAHYAQHEFNQRETSMMAALYEAGGTLTTRNGAVSVLAGSCLGGGTTVNWSAALRAPRYVLEAWAGKHGVEHVLSDEFSQSFAAVERALDVDTDESAHNPQNQALHDGAVRLGYDIGTIPRNAKGCVHATSATSAASAASAARSVTAANSVEDQTDHDIPCKACGYCCFGCQHGTKQSTVVTYLQRAFECGTRIYASTEASSVMIEQGIPKNKAVGVKAVQRTFDGRLREFSVRARLVVVAAGSIHTPALLMRSGVQHPHLGRHLNFHPTVSVAGRYARPMNPWWGNMMTALSNEVARLDGAYKEYGAKLETPPIHAGLMALALPWRSGRQHKETMLTAQNTGAFIVLTRDRDGGSVALDKRGKAVLDYDLSSYDLRHVIAGMQAAARLHIAAGAEELIFPHNSARVFRVNDARTEPTEQALERFLADMPRWGWRANEFALFTAHQMASCRMGSTRADHPLAPDGSLYDVENLYVADASAMPECSGANPMLTTQAMAHYTAQGIKARLA